MPTLTETQYESLRSLARLYSERQTDLLCAQIDAANDIQRFSLTVLWQDLGGKQPTAIEFGKPWPAQTMRRIELTRAVSRNDVDEMLRSVAANPAVVFVTPDPEGRLGLTRLEDYVF